MGSGDRDFRLLAILHLELIGTLEPGDDFLDVVHVHQVRAVDSPENLGIEVTLELFHGAEVGYALEVARADADDAILDTGKDDFLGINQEQLVMG